MCNKTTKTRKQPARRSRTRTRKPKYLSLSKHIKTESGSKSPPPSSEVTEMPRELKTLFPLHPESGLAAEDRSSGDENVAMLFQADVASDLTALLQAQTTSSSDRDDASFNHRRSLFYDNEDADSLVKSAMKRGSDERDRSEEKWVCYSEVVEEVTSTSNASVASRSKRKSKRKMKVKKEGETTTSSSVTTTMTSKSSSSPSLALKLDYEGILNAWSDKGSFIVRGEDDQLLASPQTVPDLHCDLGLTDGWGSSAANVWAVPDSGCLGIKEEPEGLKSELREASVLRYKEKRQSRLFAKRIRYEVRKLNAEKRPRIKGRFVKIG